MAKITKWYGKTEEEVKVMPMDEFMKLIPARSRRSLKRGLDDQKKRLMEEVDKDHKNIRTHNREMVIVPKMVGKTIKVYSGKEFLPVFVSVEMLGRRLGEFVMTRKPVTHGSAGLGATRSSKAVSAK